ncbi:MAG: AAA family ATPase [Alphaproteobacteria bacterium]|nr:AAA family ATPase [Alphaproteobacteria bacterium]
MSGRDRASSGLVGLDEILGGGFVRRRLHLIEGRPGTGKTTLGMQFVLAGRDQAETALDVSMSETRGELEAVAAAHGWSLAGLELCELVPPDIDGAANRQTVFRPSEVELGETMRVLFNEIERVDPARIVIDSLSEMRLLAQNPLRYRREIFAFKQFLARRSATVLALDDMTSNSSDLQLHSIVHGVVSLEELALDYGAERRRLRITKMRGVKFRGGYHDYAIRTGGLEVFPRLVSAEPPQGVRKDIILSGSSELDALLGGGLRRGTSALLVGRAGSGKSSVALSIAYAAAKQGECASLYAFDESFDGIQERASGLGMNIGPLITSDHIDVKEINPAEMSPGEFTALVCRGVAERNASVVVIDSLNGYLQAMPQERFLPLELHQLLSYLNQHGVLTLLIMAQHGLIGAVEAPIDLSYLSDAVLLLRFFEAQGKVRKAISVVKKRIGTHEDTIRELRLSSQGLQIGEPLTDFQGIMSGIPTYLGSQSMIRAASDDTHS